jgi:hypothetical protein
MAGFKENGYINGMNDVVRFNYPTGVKIHKDGSLLVSDEYNSVIRKIVLGVNEQLVLDNGIVPPRPDDVSFNYADIALTAVYSPDKPGTVSSQNLRVFQSSETSGQLGPTLSRQPGSIPPPIQGHQRGRR